MLRTGGQPTRRGSADDADEEGGGLGHVGYLVIVLLLVVVQSVPFSPSALTGEVISPKNQFRDVSFLEPVDFR